MTLDQIELNKPYKLQAIEISDLDLQARLAHFGFIPGAQVILKRRAPVFKDPLLVEVAGSQVMISKSEAQKILILQEES